MKVQKMATLKLALICKYHTIVTKRLVSYVKPPIELLTQRLEVMVSFELNEVDFEISFCDF